MIEIKKVLAGDFVRTFAYEDGVRLDVEVGLGRTERITLNPNEARGLAMQLIHASFVTEHSDTVRGKVEDQAEAGRPRD